jgi:two-component system NtrC family sensor kinase
VLEQGKVWSAPAFVVNDWYITSYEPIRDPGGRIIGVLYVGLLQAPFVHQERVITGVFIAIVSVATVVSLGMLFFLTTWVLHPIDQIVEMSKKIIAGDLTARVGVRPSGEMGILCRAVDTMADAVAKREQQLQAVTRQQIGRSEQLASVGRLAAGVAHEINNPLTGVLTFACMLRDKENMETQDREDLDVIIRETKRVAEIVRGLLDFARERPVRKVSVDLNEVVQQTIRLLGNREAFQQIVIVQDLAENLPRINGDANQIQQVVLNLSLNACEAMPHGGTLLIATAAEEDKVILKVTDTGCGIKREHLDQIFEPFFTTKPVGKGTGLGLSVSYGLVRRHGGSLDVESEAGKGSTFTVTLPAMQGTTETNPDPGGPAPSRS